MNLRDSFLQALADNEDDVTTRMVYADWLDDHGEHEEADRQRQWPAAKEWLVRFCAKHNPKPEEDDEVFIISYEELVSRGHNAFVDADDEEFGFSCGNNMGMCDALRENTGEFWKNWAIVTGVVVPPDIEDKGYFRCAC